MSNNWYVITGGPSSGKTTLLAELEKRGYAVVPEAARTVIDEHLANGISVQELRSDEQKFQEIVASMKQEIETSMNVDAVTFFDRGMHDTLAYMQHYGFAIADWIHALFISSRYKQVFLLDRLPHYEADYARTEDTNFVAEISYLLELAYVNNGMPVIHVPALPVPERLDFILKHVKQEQIA